MRKIRIAFTAALVFALFPAALLAKTLAIVPFRVHADRDVRFMADGIYDMLSTRLNRPGELEVKPRAAVERGLAALPGGFAEARAAEAARALGVDFLVFGSLTVLGEGVSLDAKAVDAAGARPALSFSEQSPDPGGIISRVNRLAGEMQAALLGKPAAAQAEATPAPAAPQAAAPPAADPQAHPEKLFRSQGGLAPEDRPSPFVSEEGGGGIELSPKFWRSASFKQLFNGLALGDVDGDGKTETVIATQEGLIVHRMEQGRFYQVHDLRNENRGIPVAVDVADINGNGRPEIFVTALTPTRRGVSSYILEHDGKAFRRVAEGLPLYFRVCRTPDRGAVLLGQEHRPGSPHSNRIHEMVWRNGRYEAEAPVSVPVALNVLGLAFARLGENRKESTVAFDRDDFIRVFEPGGAQEWRSSEKYGGSTLYFAAERADQGDVVNPIYLPMRMLPWEPGGEGKGRLLVVRNHDWAGRRLERMRFLQESQIFSFFWDGLGLAPEWRTRKITGAIRDFAVGDFANDGRRSLVAAVVLDEGHVIGTDPKSVVIALEFK
ncbi:MAG: VCBS repeat-containing protein [Desulfobacterales bacterium]